jgi:hypothetical protein
MCKKIIAHQWAMRLLDHLYYHPKAFFLTLTYDGDDDDIYSLYKPDIQNFFKRLRYYFPDRKISYFYCGEYGELYQRPHYHAIIYGLSFYELEARKIRDKFYSELIMNKIWELGYNTIGFAEKKSVYYTTGYILKKIHNTEIGNREPEFHHCSKGIGLDELGSHFDEYYEKFTNNEPLSRYYQKKIREVTKDEGRSNPLTWLNAPRRLVREGKSDDMLSAINEINISNRQQERDVLTLEKIYRQRNSL